MCRERGGGGGGEVGDKAGRPLVKVGGWGGDGGAGDVTRVFPPVFQGRLRAC